MRFRRTLLSVIFVGFFSLPAMAQDMALRPGWSFNLGAYLWLPTLDGKVNRAGSGNLNNWDKWIFCLRAA